MSALKNMAEQTRKSMINVIQGDFAISDDPEAIISTILGSCVATCLYDPVAKLGGLNHFLLPGFCDSTSGTQSCGLNMMELLINGLLRKGAMRGRLQAKVFGGADMNSGLTKIGAQNVDFTRTFLRHEGIPCVGESVGGLVGRRVQFVPTSGKARQLFLSQAETIAVEEKVIQTPTASTGGSDLELF